MTRRRLRASLISPTIERSEVVGLIAGFGTTFAALPDLLAMLKRRRSQATSGGDLA